MFNKYLNPYGRIVRKYFSEKFYKVTFSGLDKFYSSDKLNNLLCQFNEVKILRTNKSSNKNYCHVDVSTDLSADNLKIKFEGIKFLGKSVKVRVKELNEEVMELMQKNYNSLDINKLDKSNMKESRDIIKQFITNFYVKNLTDNPTHVKKILNQLENSEDWLDLIDYERELFELEYKLQVITESTKLLKLKEVFRNPTFLPIKTLTKLEEDENLDSINKSIKFIKEKFIIIFEKLGYPSFEPMTNKGVYRSLQIKFLENEKIFLVTLMVSMGVLSEIDIKIITEAIKFEFREKQNISFYISVNEKVQASVDNSTLFYFIHGNNKFLPYKDIKIFPFTNESSIPIYFHKLNMNKIFDINRFKIVFDLSSNYIPAGLLLNFESFEKYLFLKEKYNFNIYNSNSKENLLNIGTSESGNNENKGDNKENNVNNNLITVEYSKHNIEIFDKIEDMVKVKDTISELNSNDVDLSLHNKNILIINLKNPIFSKKTKYDQILSKAKYHLIISHSLSQILDFLKNFSNSNILKDLNFYVKMNKMIVIRDKKYEIKDFILALEIK